MTAHNIAASVRQKLLNRAKQLGEDFQLLLTRFANERLLYRLSQSPFRDQFVLKGATLFAIWSAEPHRATRALDQQLRQASPEGVQFAKRRQILVFDRLLARTASVLGDALTPTPPALHF